MQKAIVSTDGHYIDANNRHQNGILVKSNNVVYDAMLNQTDIGRNANKFYQMQLVQIGTKFSVYIRYGRIGEPGVINYKDFNTESDATNFFEKQFRTKTGNSWLDKGSFDKKPGKYFLTEIKAWI